MKCTVEEFADRLKSRVIQVIVRHSLEHFGAYIMSAVPNEERARLEVDTGVDFETLRLIFNGLLADFDNGRPSQTPQETVCVDLSNVKMRITASTEVMSSFLSNLGALTGPTAAELIPGAAESILQPDPIPDVQPPVPAVLRADRPIDTRRHSALDEDGKCPRCGGTYKMRGMPKHLSRCSKGRPDDTKTANRKRGPYIAKPAKAEKAVVRDDAAYEESGPPPSEMEAVTPRAGVQCLTCFELFDNAKMLSAHRTAEHFGRSSVTGSSLKGVA